MHPLQHPRDAGWIFRCFSLTMTGGGVKISVQFERASHVSARNEGCLHFLLLLGHPPWKRVCWLLEKKNKRKEGSARRVRALPGIRTRGKEHKLYFNLIETYFLLLLPELTRMRGHQNGCRTLAALQFYVSLLPAPGGLLGMTESYSGE